MSARAERIGHGELCFGCGLANLFGLQLEAERDGAVVRGRFFVKQDHQGPGGTLHPGVLTTALEEVAGLAVRAAGHDPAVVLRLELDQLSPVRLGVFVILEAELAGEATPWEAVARASSLVEGDCRELARARVHYAPGP